MEVEFGRRVTLLATLLALAVAAVVGAAIELFPTAPLGWHEVAGLLLFLLLAAATAGAWGTRAEDARRLPRAVLAMALITGMGALGGALALGRLPLWTDHLPAVLLLGLIVALLELIRVSWKPEPTELPGPSA